MSIMQPLIYDGKVDQGKPRFDTPFFVIRRATDVEELRQFLAANPFHTEEWAEDKANNPLCRLGRHVNERYPARVATICVRRYNMLDEVKAVISHAKVAQLKAEQS